MDGNCSNTGARPGLSAPHMALQVAQRLHSQSQLRVHHLLPQLPLPGVEVQTPSGQLGQRIRRSRIA